MTSFKITIIGAGSVGFTKKLCSDILKVAEFELHDDIRVFGHAIFLGDCRRDGRGKVRKTKNKRKHFQDQRFL